MIALAAGELCRVLQRVVAVGTCGMFYVVHDLLRPCSPYETSPAQENARHTFQVPAGRKARRRRAGCTTDPAARGPRPWGRSAPFASPPRNQSDRPSLAGCSPDYSVSSRTASRRFIPTLISDIVALLRFSDDPMQQAGADHFVLTKLRGNLLKKGVAVRRRNSLSSLHQPVEIVLRQSQSQLVEWDHSKLHEKSVLSAIGNRLNCPGVGLPRSRQTHYAKVTGKLAGSMAQPTVGSPGLLYPSRVGAAPHPASRRGF